MQIAPLSPTAGSHRPEQGSAGATGAPVAGVTGPEKTGRDGRELSSEEQREVQRLKTRDREVHAHERAHQAAGGSYVRGGPSYETKTGPDGKSYAVGGEVQIDTSPVAGNPAATIQKMQQVRRAALAPADPSSADRRVAAAATQKEQAARKELAEETRAGVAAHAGGASSRESSPEGDAVARYEASSAYGVAPAPSAALNAIA